MRRATLLGLGLAVPVLVLAADAAAAWTQGAFEDAFYRFVKSDSQVPIPAVPKGLKLLAGADRKAAVDALAARARAYYASEAFRKRWVQDHGGSYADPGAAKRAADTRAQQDKAMAQQDKALADMEAAMANMPPEYRAMMKANLAKAKGEMAKAKKETRAAKEDPRPAAAVPDAKAALKAALQRFLAASEGVDYDAVLLHQNGRSTFANGAYERKPDAWKACFRAGRQATEAARAHARTWLAELK